MKNLLSFNMELEKVKGALKKLKSLHVNLKSVPTQKSNNVKQWESKQTPLQFSSTTFRAWNVPELLCNQVLMWSSTVEWSEWESVQPVIDIHIKTGQRRCWDVSKQHSNVQTHADPTGSGRLFVAMCSTVCFDSWAPSIFVCFQL